MLFKVLMPWTQVQNTSVSWVLCYCKYFFRCVLYYITKELRQTSLLCNFGFLDKVNLLNLCIHLTKLRVDEILECFLLAILCSLLCNQRLDRNRSDLVVWLRISFFPLHFSFMLLKIMDWIETFLVLLLSLFFLPKVQVWLWLLSDLFTSILHIIVLI